MRSIFSKLWRKLTRAELESVVDSLVEGGKGSALNTMVSQFKTTGGVTGKAVKVVEVTTTGTSPNFTHKIPADDYDVVVSFAEKGLSLFAKYKVGTAYGYSPIFVGTNSNALQLYIFIDGTKAVLTKASS